MVQNINYGYPIGMFMYINILKGRRTGWKHTVIKVVHKHAPVDIYMAFSFNIYFVNNLSVCARKSFVVIFLIVFFCKTFSLFILGVKVVAEIRPQYCRWEYLMSNTGFLLYTT